MKGERVVVITGGANGIGKQTALKFASKGDLVVIADIEEEAGIETMKEIHNHGGQAIFVKTDVTMYEEVEELIEKAVSEYGNIHIMFNNAGTSRYTPVLDQNLDDYYHVINVNQHGVLHGIRAAGRKMRELGTRGVIINTSSVYGFVASRRGSGTFAYHVTKGALIMMTKSAALDLSEYGIRVVGIAPGAVETRMLQGLQDERIFAAVKDKFMTRKLTKPEQIADTVYLLSLDEANAINGSVVMVDEGFTSFK